MEKGSGSLRILFEDPFWIGLFELVSKDQLCVCKITFGAEPKDQEILDFVLHCYFRLRFSPSISVVQKQQRKNPKRIQREIRKQAEVREIGTKAQQALKLQHDERKTERRTAGRDQKELQEKMRFALSQQKRKEKHRGR